MSTYSSYIVENITVQGVSQNALHGENINRPPSLCYSKWNTAKVKCQRWKSRMGFDSEYVWRNQYYNHNCIIVNTLLLKKTKNIHIVFLLKKPRKQIVGSSIVRLSGYVGGTLCSVGLDGLASC